MKNNYICRKFESGESQIEFIHITDMNTLINSIKTELAEINCALYLANPSGDIYKDEYQLQMNTNIGTALVDVSEIDESLTIRAHTELVNHLDKLFQEHLRFVKDKK